MSRLDFVGPLEEAFRADGYLRAFVLDRLALEHGGVTIAFEAEQPYPGAFRLHVPLPRRIGDHLWNEYDDLAQSEAEWILIGICIPLEEAYYTQALSTPTGRDGVKTLEMP